MPFHNARRDAMDAAEHQAVAGKYEQAYKGLYGIKAQAKHIAASALLGGGLGAIGGFMKGVYDNYIATPNSFHTAPESQLELNLTPDYSDNL